MHCFASHSQADLDTMWAELGILSQEFDQLSVIFYFYSNASSSLLRHSIHVLGVGTRL